MKILYFTTFDLSLPKGPSINEREFLGELLRHPAIEARAVVPRSALEMGEFAREKIRPIRHAWGPSVISIIASELELGVAISRELAEFEPEIVVGRLALLPFGCLFAMRPSTTPFAIKTLGSAGFVTSGWSATQIATRCLRPIVRIFLRHAARKSCVIDTVTEQLRSLLIRELGILAKTVVVVPNSTNINRFYPQSSQKLRLSLGIGQNSLVLGYVGGVPLLRGGREVIRAVKRIREIGIDAYGVIVGGSVSELSAFASSLGVSSFIQIRGRVDYADIPDWINVIDVGIALDNSTRAMQTGNSYQKVRQFISCGRFILSPFDEDDLLAKCPLAIRLKQNHDEEIFSNICSILALSKQVRLEHQHAGREFAKAHLSVSSALEKRLEIWEACIVT